MKNFTNDCVGLLMLKVIFLITYEYQEGEKLVKSVDREGKSVTYSSYVFIFKLHFVRSFVKNKETKIKKH